MKKGGPFLWKKEVIFNEKYQARSLWKAEYIDAKFEQKQDGLYLLTNHIIQSDNSLKPQTIEKLEDCITGSYYVDLKFNNQGMPIRKSKYNEYKQGENIYFFNPIDKLVVRFGAYSDGANLSCDGGPSSSGEGLGVRKIFHMK